MPFSHRWLPNGRWRKSEQTYFPGGWPRQARTRGGGRRWLSCCHKDLFCLFPFFFSFFYSLLLLPFILSPSLHYQPHIFKIHSLELGSSLTLPFLPPHPYPLIQYPSFTMAGGKCLFFFFFFLCSSTFPRAGTVIAAGRSIEDRETEELWRRGFHGFNSKSRFF